MTESGIDLSKPYLSIAASAGSGKTFQLSHRYLWLLAQKVAPDEIGAYTFSRKAAGEIFDSIVASLRKAAESDLGAGETSEILGLTQSKEAFCSDLRRLFESLHRLRIGTLDSRISQMLSAVSVELGLPPEFSLLDTHSAEYLRLQNQVLNELFRSGALKKEEADTFLQLFLEATHGTSEKKFLSLIQQFLSDHRSTFLGYPEIAAWRGPLLETPPVLLEASERERFARDIIDALPDSGLDEKHQSILAGLTTACQVYQVSSTRGDLPADVVSKRFLAGEGPEVKSGRSTLIVSDAIWQKLEALLNHVLAVSCQQVQSRTLALYGFLWVYQKAYSGAMIPGGQLSFEDACMLMADFDLLEPVEMAYRLDGELSHWLLDEFQDTNRLQWKVLEPFVSEILQDPESRRSFFYVGDVKQAIYAWRGGDSELFGKIQEDWPLIERESMAVSYRSAPPVLEVVNTLFSKLPLVDALPPTALKRWNSSFEEHQPAKKDLRGFAEVVELTDADQDVTQVILKMAKQLPSNIETAILVRTNDEGSEIAAALRSEGLKVSQEGSSVIRDDTAVEAVLAALRQAAHPLDNFSRNFLQIVDLHTDSFKLLQQVQNEGITVAVRYLISKLSLGPDAVFSKTRLKRLVDVAMDFDRLGDPSIDRFLSLVEKTRLKENEARGVIRIMTIHQSKGLGFDAVIVPVKPRSTFSKMDSDTLVTSPADVESPVVTLLPPKVVCQQIPEYLELYERLDAEKTYETLCTLYVALTRAKQSLQVILPAAPKSGGSLSTVSNWMRDRIGHAKEAPSVKWTGAKGLARWGSENWNEESGGLEKKQTSPQPFLVSSGSKTLPRLEPSREASHPQAIDREFTYVEKDGRDLGSRVHALLEHIEWADEVDAKRFFEEHNEGQDSEAALHITKALTIPEFARPADAIEVWREQRFESVLPEGWITGIFDRVVLFPNRAWIQDFKTNQQLTDSTIENYRPQMELYRRVLADMLDLSPESIQCQLLFTKTGEVVEV